MSEKNKRVTLKDVAAASGVSETTVSLALRNHPRISKATKKKVEETVARLGYKPNALVAALMSNVSRSRSAASEVPLAVVYSVSRKEAEQGVFHKKLWAGMSSRASELGFYTERFFVSPKDKDPNRLTEILYARNINGVIIPPLRSVGGGISLDWSRFSAIAIGYSMPEPSIHRVCPDPYRAVRLALKEARLRGYSRPGLVVNGFESELRSFYLWSSGFYGFEHASKIQDIIPVLDRDSADSSNLLSWYEQYMPDVIISSGKEMDVWNELQRAGVNSPDNVGFISLCYSEQYPEVSGVNERETQIGRVAVEQLVLLLHQNERGIPECGNILTVPPCWVEGKTCVALRLS